MPLSGKVLTSVSALRAQGQAKSMGTLLPTRRQWIKGDPQDDSQKEPMINNPYQPPESIPFDFGTSVLRGSSPQRAAALFYVRLILGILLVPATYNFICFNYPPQTISPIPLAIHNVFRLANLVGLIAIVWMVYYAGLWLFEALARAFHAIFSRQPTLPLWLDVLYATFIGSTPYAVAGAILWAIWVYGFYQTNVDFMALSVPIGILAHILAAARYLPLGYRWYQIERDARSVPTSDAGQ